MIVQRLIVGSMRVNCYLIYSDVSQEALVIDPGDDGEYISQKIVDLELKPSKIIATHGHFDHIMAVAEVQMNFNIPFFIHQSDEFLVKRMRKSAKHFLKIDAGHEPRIDGYIFQNDVLQLGEERLQIIETPGHTPGSISLINKTDKIAFVGDVIFSDGRIGRTDFSYSDPALLSKSIDRIENGYLIYPGHGEGFTLARR